MNYIWGNQQRSHLADAEGLDHSDGSSEHLLYSQGEMVNNPRQSQGRVDRRFLGGGTPARPDVQRARGAGHGKDSMMQSLVNSTELPRSTG